MKNALTVWVNGFRFSVNSNSNGHSNCNCNCNGGGRMPSLVGKLYSMRGITIEQVRGSVGDLLRARGVVRASVFGSVARGEARPDSDVDFLVEFEPGRTLVDLSGLRLDLMERLGRTVDIVTHAALHPKLKAEILREQVRVL